MTIYSYAQLEQLWINAGGPRAVAPVAAAVAEAESSGNSEAENKTDNYGRQTSWGLWQISDGTHNQPVPDILDPAVNAAAAVAKWKAAGGSFSPDWGTYDSGAYKQYMNGSTTPDPNVPAPATLTSTGGSDCLFDALPHTSFCVLKKSQARALIGGAMLAAGGLVIVVGVALVAVFALQKTGVAQTIVQFTPVGRATGAISGAARASARPKPRPKPAKAAAPPRPKTPAAPRPKPAAAPKPPGPRSPAQGRHAKRGANAPAKGKHAAPAS